MPAPGPAIEDLAAVTRVHPVPGGGRVPPRGRPDVEGLSVGSDADCLALDAGGTHHQSHQVFATIAIEDATAGY
jgi:hypothetical protein